MRYAAEHKQQTRERVLKEAAKAIRADGVNRIAVAAVMAKAGLTSGGFYAHFASKEDFLGAAIDQMFVESADRLARFTTDRPAAEGLAAYLDFYLSPAHRDTRTAGCPLPFLSGDAPRMTIPARERVAAGVGRLTGKVAALLTDMGRTHPEDEASSMVSEIVGAVCLARVELDPERSDLILARTRAALSERLGLRPRQQA